MSGKAKLFACRKASQAASEDPLAGRAAPCYDASAGRAAPANKERRTWKKTHSKSA